MAIFEDGTGSGNKAKINKNKRLFTTGVDVTEEQAAVALGNGYSINTGLIGLTTSTESGILYFKNNENQPIIISSLIIGIGSAGTKSDSAVITVVNNPTGGTLISGATSVDINSNRDLGSAQTLSAIAYKGAEGSTVTGGTDSAIILVSGGNRAAIELNYSLPKGSSLAVTIDSNTTAGTTNVYAALVCHLKDINNE